MINSINPFYKSYIVKKKKKKQTTEPLEIMFLYNHWNIPSLAVERFKTQKETIF